MKVVATGGGSALAQLLLALREVQRVMPALQITALPNTTDDGGSSGEIKRAIMQTEGKQVIAVGDVSQCILALHEKPDVVAPMFSHRFEEGPFKGHTMRNMVVLALLERFGHNQGAMDELRQLLDLHGRIVPVTFSTTMLHVRLKDGTEIAGEDNISQADLMAHGGVEDLWLDPPVEANPAAIKAIEEADLIMVAPGQPHGSLPPNFRVKGIREAMQASRAMKVCVANLVNRKGHVPEDWTVSDHVDYLERYLYQGFFNVVVSNTGRLSPEQIEAYEAGEGKIAVPPVSDTQASDRILLGLPLLMNGTAKFAGSDKIASTRSLVRHDPVKLGLAVKMIIDYYCMPQRAPYIVIAFDGATFDSNGFSESFGADNRLEPYIAGDDFEEDELAQFIYPDVLPVLEAARGLGLKVVLTVQESGNSGFQRRKVGGSGILQYVDKCIYVGVGKNKGAALAEAIGRDARGLYVDVLSESAEPVATACPELRFLQIDRVTRGQLGNVRSFEELRPFFKDLKPQGESSKRAS